MNPSQTVSLSEVVRELLRGEKLRAHYKTTNKEVDSVQNITHHGWIHIVMVVTIARMLGKLFGLRRNGEVDEQSLVELACLVHDIGLSKGRRLHAKNGALMVEEILSPYGVQGRDLDIIRAMVRFHRAEDCVRFVEEIYPRREYILQRLREGDSIENLVPPRDPEEDPSTEDVRLVLELMDEGVRFMVMYAVQMVGDLVDVGRSRVRKTRRRSFYQHCPEALRLKRITLEDVLRRRRVPYSEFDLANFAVTELELILKNEEGEVARVLMQDQTTVEDKGRRRGKCRKRSHLYRWGGLFAWARNYAHLEGPDAREQALDRIPPCVRITQPDGVPTKLILRGVHDREVCAPSRVEEIKADYLAALAASARMLALEPTTEIRSSMVY